ncbi:MaoC family dehydratase [Piscinibacter sp. XHJ-5]|uniref:MaoC family dehydratase n=1 Tax=Piscinibacter sp. XHJ-5 TaxID=3037797 RepID=UPI002452EC6F|nr:MaoC family dehydratase [Piscinibacter sp. XHJ-5]
MAIPPNYLFATLNDHVGHDFGASTPTRLDQPRIDRFAECTGDDQWIHVDVERARTQTPTGSTIAHGLLLLSLIPAAQYELGVYPRDASNVLNYGFDRVRFLAPVTAGTSIALRVELAEVADKGPGRTLVRCRNTAYAVDAPERPVMVAESLGMVIA